MMNALPSSGVSNAENKAEKGAALDITEKRNCAGLAVVDMVEEKGDLAGGLETGKWAGEREEAGEALIADDGDGDNSGGDEDDWASLKGSEKGMLTLLRADGGNKRLDCIGWPFSKPTQKNWRGRTASCKLHTLACSGVRRTPPFEFLGDRPA